jgi:hypothetical protein
MDETSSNPLPPARHSPGLKWINWLLYPLMALMAVHIGRDNSIKELLQVPSYYTDLLLAFACTYAVGFYIKKMLARVFKKYQWQTQLKKMLLWQLLYTVLLPLVLVIGIELLYLAFFLNIPLGKSAVFYLELPLATIFILVLNLLYSVVYIRRQSIQWQQQWQQKNNTDARMPAVSRSLLVHRGSAAIQLPLSEVAFFIILNKTTFLITADNEKYLYNIPLQEIEQQLPAGAFFLLNRQVLAAKTAVKGYQRTETRKLLVSLAPALPEEQFVSKARAGQFIQWLE